MLLNASLSIWCSASSRQNSLFHLPFPCKTETLLLFRFLNYVYLMPSFNMKLFPSQLSSIDSVQVPLFVNSSMSCSSKHVLVTFKDFLSFLNCDFKNSFIFVGAIQIIQLYFQHRTQLSAEPVSSLCGIIIYQTMLLNYHSSNKFAWPSVTPVYRLFTWCSYQ